MNSQVEYISNEMFKRLQSTISETEWTLWFIQTSIVSMSDKEIFMHTPTVFSKDYIDENYKKMIENIFFDMLGQKYILVLEVNTELNKTKKTPNEPIVIPTPNLSNNKTKNNYSNYKLNKKYTFDSFIVGENNSFAANAAIAVSKNLGTQYNPLLIYGGVGLGKTHLIQAIGNEIIKSGNDKNILYINAEDFITEFIDSIPKKKTNEFKNKYRSADLLLIDDIHFFQGKKQTQEELFHTFNTLYDNDRQIIFTCDRPVSELKDLTDRLRSRFTRGMNIDLQPPKYEVRYSILKQKMENEKNKFSNAQIPNDILDFLAKNIGTNIRDLEAAFTTLAGYSDLVNVKLTVEIAKDKLKDLLNAPKQQNISISIIMQEVANYYKYELTVLLGKSQQKSIVTARQVGMYITNKITDLSSTEIGKYFSKDHSTVLHSISKINDLLKVNDSIQNDINKIIQTIKQICVNL